MLRWRVGLRFDQLQRHDRSRRQHGSDWSSEVGKCTSVMLDWS